MTLVLCFVVCVALHEMAHALMAEWVGLTVLGLVWRLPLGIGVKRTQGTPVQHFWIAAAGPAMTLFLAWAFWAHMPRLAAGNLAFAVLSLAPMSSSDGARMLRAWENIRSGYMPYTRRG